MNRDWALLFIFFGYFLPLSRVLLRKGEWSKIGDLSRGFDSFEKNDAYIKALLPNTCVGPFCFGVSSISDLSFDGLLFWLIGVSLVLRCDFYLPKDIFKGLVVYLCNASLVCFYRPLFIMIRYRLVI